MVVGDEARLRTRRLALMASAVEVRLLSRGNGMATGNKLLAKAIGKVSVSRTFL
jgi:hypothetical protein